MPEDSPQKIPSFQDAAPKPTALLSAADQLGEADRAAAHALVRAVTRTDGVSPVSEDGRLALIHGRAGSRHFGYRSGEELGGYLYLGPPDEQRDRTAELCVAPKWRRQGLGEVLLKAALAETAGVLRVWAHGSRPGTRELAERLGFTAVRDLRLMELDLRAEPAREYSPPRPPEGIELDTFKPGRDEEAWLALNARAFAHHPEQGAWTRRDLAEREAEPWFDPAGFFLARTQQGLVGFHWTKVHPAGAYGPEPVGEIYVLGVDPDAGGRGLGRLLALAGIRHLAQNRLNTVILYVDGDNLSAVRLYQSLGFRNRAVDTLYERHGTTG